MNNKKQIEIFHGSLAEIQKGVNDCLAEISDPVPEVLISGGEDGLIVTVVYRELED